MSCCICFNELSNWEYQCQTCTDGIICYACFHNVTNRRYLNLLRDISINDIKKILCCPCCRQINWKHLHNEIVTNMYFDITDDYNYDTATPAENVFYRNWSSIEKDDDIDNNYNSDEDNDFGQTNDIILNEIKIGDIVKLKLEVGKPFWVIVNKIFQTEYIGTINRVTSEEYKFGEMVYFTKDDIV